MNTHHASISITPVLISALLACMHNACMGQVNSQNIVGYTTTASDDALTHGEFSYTLKAGEATIVDYSGSNPCMNVPETIAGHPVKAVGQTITGVSLGSSPFSQRKHLKRILIPASVATINSGAFGGCENLVEVSLGSGVTNIDGCAFGACSSLEKFTVATDNRTFKDIEGVLFSRDGKELVLYPIGNKQSHYVLPASVIAIGAGVFSGCSSLERFSVATDNKRFKADDGVLFSINGKALVHYPGGCKRTHYVIPNSVAVISAGAFSNCSKLESIVMPAGVTRISDFASCANLSAAYFEGDAPSLTSGSHFHARTKIYYRPGAKGWGPTFGGRPTAVWKE